MLLLAQWPGWHRHLASPVSASSAGHKASSSSSIRPTCVLRLLCSGLALLNLCGFLPLWDSPIHRVAAWQLPQRTRTIARVSPFTCAGSGVMATSSCGLST